MAKGFLHRRSSQFVALVMSSLACTAWADTVTLKNGEVVEGKILRESESEIVVSISVGSGIKDERIITKEEVESVSRISEDTVAFEGLKWYKVGRDSHTLIAYENMMRALEVFLGRYPNSAHAEEIKTNLYALRDENARVKKGEVKWNDQWYSADDGAKLAYQISGHQLYTQMKEKAGRGDAIAALNLFSRLEKEYPGCRDYPDAVELALRLIPKVVHEAERRTADARERQTQFAARINAVGEPERTRLIKTNEAAIAEEKRKFEAAERLQLTWKPILPLEERSATSIRNAATAYLPRLKGLNVHKMRDGIVATTAGEKALANGDLATAEEKLREAVSLWPGYERLVHLNAAIKVVKEEREAAERESKAAAEAAKGKKSS